MKIIDFFQEKIVDTIAVILFFVSAGWMIIEALSRQFLNKSFAISEELVVFSLVWAVLLTLGSSGRMGYHVSLDLVTRNFKGKFKKINNIVITLVSIFYTLFIVYVGVQYVGHLLNTGTTSHSPMKLPMGYVLMVVPIGMGLLFWYYFKSLIKQIKSWGDQSGE